MRNSVNFYLQKLIRLNIKIFICALILALNFNSFSKADDISEFEIEGLSIGYSLLNKYSKKEIEDLYKASYYKDNEYTTIESLKLSEDSQYDYISLSYKTSDNKYSLVGIIADIDSKESFNNNIEKCYDIKNEIVEELKVIFSNSTQKDNKAKSHTIDKTGKSKVTTYVFYLQNNDYVTVACYDYTKEIGYPDSLRIGLVTNEFNTWLATKAYK